jgi:hypothetical protein
MRNTQPPRIRFAAVFCAAAAVVLGATVPADAGAQQSTPPKAATAPQPRDASAVDDLFLPPMRGTPDGRISGGTRGLHKPSPQPVADVPPTLPSTGPGAATAPATPPVRPKQGAPGAAGQ